MTRKNITVSEETHSEVKSAMSRLEEEYDVDLYFDEFIGLMFGVYSPVTVLGEEVDEIVFTQEEK